MAVLKRNKKYKALDPFETINRARLALQKCDCFVVEKDLYSKIAKTYTSRVWLGDEDIFDLEFGTNGKGMTPRYSLASAYGEMMERLQNKILFTTSDVMSFMYCGEYSNKSQEFIEFLKVKGIDIDYQYSPDEKWLSIDEVYNDAGKYLSEMYGVQKNELKALISEFASNHHVLCTPFYSITEDKAVYIPIYMVFTACGSNGMCAGNTPKEALIQGMAEIYERYASKLIFLNKLDTPIIDESYFEGTEVLKKLIALREKGYDFDILDFSCGIGLPVVALRLIRKSDGAIAIRPGADPSPITALERCLTEMYQVIGSMEVRFRHTPIKSIDENSSEEEIDAYFKSYQQMLSEGAGDWPDNVQTTKKIEGFKGFNHPISVSDEIDFEYMLSVARNLGKYILVRDNSFLDFPAFSVVIPSISECYIANEGKNKVYKCFCPTIDKTISYASQLAKASLEDLLEFKTFFTKQMEERKFTRISTCYYFPVGLDMPDIIQNPEEFIKAIDFHINYLEGNGKPVFTYENWPNCYECDECAYSNDCRLVAVGKKLKALTEQEKLNLRKQNKEMFEA